MASWTKLQFVIKVTNSSVCCCHVYVCMRCFYHLDFQPFIHEKSNVDLRQSRVSQSIPVWTLVCCISFLTFNLNVSSTYRKMFVYCMPSNQRHLFSPLYALMKKKSYHLYQRVSNIVRSLWIVLYLGCLPKLTASFVCFTVL